MTPGATSAALDAAFVRVEEMLWLPGAIVAADDGNAGLDMLLQRFPTRLDAPLFDALPELRALVGRRFETDDTLSADAAAALTGRGGFVFNACAATMRYATPAPTPSFAHWGNTWNAWLYAATDAEIARVALAWAATCHATDRRFAQERYGWSDGRSRS